MNIRTVEEFINAERIEIDYFLAKKNLNPTKLSKILNVTQPAVTKALNNEKSMSSLRRRIASMKRLGLENNQN
jgi:hypothetical protein